MKGGKPNAVGDVNKANAAAKERRKRSQFRTRVDMDFDPKTTKLHSQEEVDKYLAKYGVHLSQRSRSSFALRALILLCLHPMAVSTCIPKFWHCG